MWTVEQKHDVIRIFYYTRGWQQEGTAENTSGEPSYGPGREPDCLKPAGTWVGVSTRMYNDSNSLGDRAKEGRGSERRHAGTGEGISARIHVANSHGDKASGGSRCSRRRQQVVAGGSKQTAVESKQGSLHGKVRDKAQKWREMRNARLSLLWHSVARGRQQENSHMQVGSARASLLAFSPVASQPRHFSNFPKNGEKCEMRVFRCHGTRSRAASSRRSNDQQVGSARASPLAFNPIACQPRQASLHQWLSVEAITARPSPGYFFFLI